MVSEVTVHVKYKVDLGTEHLTTSHFGLLFTDVLSNLVDDEAAIALFWNSAQVQAGKQTVAW